NKNMVSGRQVDDGDSITVLDVGYSQQLALVQYPTSAGVRQGYINNTPSVIKYNDANAWANGSTTEIVYDENGGQLGSLSPYESATPLYKKNGMTHVVYNTDKGPNTKSGYVKYEGGSVTKITIPKPSTSGVSTISYGKSGKERDLAAYKIGNGNNSLVMVCEVHGYEDNFPKDGLELVNIGNDLIRSLASNGTKGWSVYVIPAANPDGLAEGYTNNGPGRCTIVGGVDINRDFPIGFTSHGTPRYWTGDKPLSVNESSKLSEFIQGIKNKTSGKMVVIDLHGWEGAAIGNPEIGQYFRNQFGFEQRSGYGADRGFLIAWAKSIGADAALIELPKNTHSHSDVINGGYSQKVINAVNGILSNNPGGGSTDKWVQKGDSWYYYENGLMVTGWKSINGSWYYLESSGAMATGWNSIDGSWYYLESSGAMATGWKQINNLWYYMESNGHMVNGENIIDGTKYIFNSSGALVSGNAPNDKLTPKEVIEEKATQRAKEFFENIISEVGITGDFKLGDSIKYFGKNYILTFTAGLESSMNPDAPVKFKVTDGIIDDSTLLGIIIKNRGNYSKIFMSAFTEFIAKFTKEIGGAEIEITPNIFERSLDIKIGTTFKDEENNSEYKLYYNINIQITFEELGEKVKQSIKDLIESIKDRIKNPTVADGLIVLVIIIAIITPADEIAGIIALLGKGIMSASAVIIQQLSSSKLPEVIQALKLIFKLSYNNI
ncbi:bacteriocin, partial [Clostridium algidicarnis]|uniref:M14 family zinc carboxypeptidase n=1 Tax=Clostridium algidicarnis TaxID=37659 RepID=UPI001CF2F02E